MARVRWWHSAIFAVLVAAYLTIGLTGYDTHAPDNDLYNIAGVGTCLAGLLFMIIYTLLGLRPGRAGWWTNLTGYSLMVAIGSITLKTAIVSWATLFHHGLINTPVSAWFYVGASWLQFLALLSLCGLWLWNRNAHGAAAPPEEPTE